MKISSNWKRFDCEVRKSRKRSGQSSNNRTEAQIIEQNISDHGQMNGCQTHGIVPRLFFSEAEVLLDLFEVDFDVPTPGVCFQNIGDCHVDIVAMDNDPWKFRCQFHSTQNPLHFDRFGSFFILGDIVLHGHGTGMKRFSLCSRIFWTVPIVFCCLRRCWRQAGLQKTVVAGTPRKPIDTAIQCHPGKRYQKSFF